MNATGEKRRKYGLRARLERGAPRLRPAGYDEAVTFWRAEGLAKAAGNAELQFGIVRTILIALVSFSALSAAAAEGPGRTIRNVFAEGTAAPLPYLLYLPDGCDHSRSYPLALCFHGAGGRGNDNRGGGTEAGAVLRSKESQQKYPCIVLQPQCPENERWVESPISNYRLAEVPASKWMNQVFALLRTLMLEHRIDPTRIYVTGQSLGGFATWDALARQPALFAAAVPVCGGGDPSQVPNFANVPIWVFHGSDDPRVRVTTSREMVAALKRAGSAVRFSDLEGVAHNSWTPAWREEPKLIPWLFQQRRTEPGKFSD